MSAESVYDAAVIAAIGDTIRAQSAAETRDQALARELAEQNDAADIEQELIDSAYDDHLDRIAEDQDRSELEDEE